MQWCVLVSATFLLLLLDAQLVRSFPDGAPKNRKVCRTLKPHHEHTHAQTTAAPYSVTTDKSKIPIGSSVKVTISANSGSSYKGFVMQARPRMIANVGYIKPLGTFSIIDTKNSKTIDCLSAVKNTVTHSNPTEKTSTSFTWTPPDKYKGPVYFRASFVKDFDTYWLNVSSSIVVGDSDTVDPIWTLTDSEDVENEIEQVSPMSDIYDECGLTKSCFGIPHNCLLEESCDALVTIAAKERKFEFEMVGKGAEYVAVSLSESGFVDKSSVMQCTVSKSDTVSLDNSNYYKYHRVESQITANVERDLINSTYVDGFVYCKFEKEEITRFRNVEYDLKNKQYFILLALGNHDKGNRENINLDNVEFHASTQKKLLSDVSAFHVVHGLPKQSEKKSNLAQVIYDFLLGLARNVMLT